MQGVTENAPLFDTGDKIALVAAIVALLAMGVAIWQAYEARQSRKATRDQADTAEKALDETKKQSAAAEKSATAAMLSVGSAERAAGAAEDQVTLARQVVRSAEVQAESARQQVRIMLDQLADTRADRTERINAEQRQAIVDVLRTGNRWMDTLTPILDLYLHRDNATADESRQAVANFDETRAAYISAITSARLSLSHEILRLYVEILEYEMDIWPVKLTRVAGLMVQRNGVVSEEAFREALAARSTLRKSLENVKKLAERLYVTKTADPTDETRSSIDGNDDTTSQSAAP